MSNTRTTAAGGFTLVELMVTMAVVGILAMVAAPAMTAMIDGNRLTGTASELTASLQLARSEALRRSSSVRICGSSDGATCGGDWSRWIVTGTESVTGAAVTIQDSAAVADSVQVTGPAGGIVFRSSGLIDGEQQLLVCVPSGSLTENQRRVRVMISGTVVSERVSGGGSCP